MEPSPESILTQLELLLASEALSKSAANRRLLQYLVQRSLSTPDGPKEAEIAIDFFARDARFNGAEDSVVRVAMRSLRQKLLEHYTGAGRHDALVFNIPKGSYRVAVSARAAESAIGSLPQAAAPPRHWKWAASLVLAALIVSVAINVLLWGSVGPKADAAQEQVRRSALWAPMATSQRPLMFVVGDLFMYTQTDPKTGRTQTVRDSRINSSDDLRTFLADNPSLAAERGLRYSTLIQKSAAVGMVEILRLVDTPGRRIEVRLRDELSAEDIRTFDIVYVGPITRLGPLASDYHVRSRYRFDAATASITDTESGKVYAPEGELGDHHTDYALVARYPGPAGNSIMVFTSGGRNAGLLQIVRTLTSPEGLKKFWQSGGRRTDPPASFEALLAVSGYKQTDLSAELVQLHPLGAGTAMASSEHAP
jgi:hypothetical protein